MYHFSNKSFVHTIKFCLLPYLNQIFEVSAQNNLMCLSSGGFSAAILQVGFYQLPVQQMPPQ